MDFTHIFLFCIMAILVTPVKIHQLPPNSHLVSEFQVVPANRQIEVEEILNDLPLIEIKYLHVDREGMLFYSDPTIDLEDPWGNIDETEGILKPKFKPPKPTNPKRGVEDVTQTATVPVYHSRPGAPHTLYLDFDGEYYATGTTAWPENSAAPLTAAAYSKDDLSTFNSAELTEIFEIWKRVTEDYSPWNIDVTTERPAVIGNTVCHVVITSSTTGMPGSNSGGQAYIGVHGNYGKYRPAWVYAENLGPNYGPYVGEAASHESGHNMGLSHDGVTGATYYSGIGNWAPIMGSSYGKQLSQWSIGDYPGATNTQDDLAIISSKLPLAPLLNFVATQASPTCQQVDYLFQPNIRKITYQFTTTASNPTVKAFSKTSVGNIHSTVTITCGGANYGTSSGPGSITSSVTLSPSPAIGTTCLAIIESTGDSTIPYSNYGSVGSFTVEFCNAKVLGVYDPSAPTPAPQLPPPTPTPPPPPTATCTCCFYDLSNYGGSYWCINAGVSYPSLSSYSWANRISAFSCSGGAYAIIYKSRGYDGPSITSSCNAATPSISSGLNNLGNSLKVIQCTAGAIVAANAAPTDYFQYFNGKSISMITSDGSTITDESSGISFPWYAWLAIAVGIAIIVLAIIVVAVRKYRLMEGERV